MTTIPGREKWDDWDDYDGECCPMHEVKTPLFLYNNEDWGIAYREREDGQVQFQMTCNDDHARAFAEREGWRGLNGSLNTLPSIRAKHRSGVNADFRAVTSTTTEETRPLRVDTTCGEARGESSEPSSSSSLRRHNYGTPKMLKRPSFPLRESPSTFTSHDEERVHTISRDDEPESNANQSGRQGS